MPKRMIGILAVLTASIMFMTGTASASTSSVCRCAPDGCIMKVAC